MRTAERTFGSTRFSRRLMAAAMVPAASLLVAGCSSSPKQSALSPSVAPTSAAASPSPNASDAAKAQLLTEYRGFWNLQVQAYTQGSLEGLPISAFAIGKADANVRASVQYYRSQGLVMRGRPTLSPIVTALNLASKTATITDCIDSANYRPVNKATGQPAQLADKVFRHPWTFQATFDNVQWRIYDDSVDRTVTC
ncbi:hypothetical protein [Streptacidiphilus anmyonensis]|uniref:hypothetical protein n=1 Tax=Streptacidiphilus anmyonensis TaxID=405782 RepID=UPI00128D3F31|nr:hypothetical protein [Streptacidiphilus anmyonensis]